MSFFIPKKEFFGMEDDIKKRYFSKKFSNLRTSDFQPVRTAGKRLFPVDFSRLF